MQNYENMNYNVLQDSFHEGIMMNEGHNLQLPQRKVKKFEKVHRVLKALHQGHKQRLVGIKLFQNYIKTAKHCYKGVIQKHKHMVFFK